MTITTERIILISDLHLEAGKPELTKAFLHFIDTRVIGADALYILGDFFNLWIGDDQHSELSHRISQALARLPAIGTEIYIMHGNRDFLIGDAFCSQCHATLISDPWLLEAFEKRYLLMHGDSLCTRDTAYMEFRRQVRDPAWQAEFLSNSLPERQAFADKARAESLSMSSNKPADIMDVTPDEVVRVMEQNQSRLLIHGHTHRPAIHDLSIGDKAAKRFVLGDWDAEGWYLELSAQGEELMSFPIPS